MGCWLSKQSNATALASSGLLADVKDVRHASLQNKAATDFLLLAHGHACKDFEGMCCMNLSDHSESIQKSIQQLKEGVSKRRIDDGTWLDDLFSGWGLAKWLKKCLTTGLYILVVVVIFLVMLLCFFQCVQRMIDKSIKGIYLVQKGGGDAGNRGVKTSAVNAGFDLQPWKKHGLA